jgi:hypothetical protein
MSSLTLLNLQTPPAPAPEPSPVKVEAPTKPPTMECNRPPMPKQPIYNPPQVRFEGPKVVGAGIVHPIGHDNAGKAVWADPAPEHGPANFNCSAERNRDLGLVGGVAPREQRIGGKVVGSSLILGRR